MILDACDVLIAQSILHAGEEFPPTQCGELVGLRIGEPPQSLDRVDQAFQQLDRPAQHVVGMACDSAEIVFLLLVDCFDGEHVELSDDFRMIESVLQNSLPIFDRFEIVSYGGQDDLPNNLMCAIIVSCHRGEEGAQFQILDECGRIPGETRMRVEILGLRVTTRVSRFTRGRRLKRPLPVEIAVAIEEMRLHEPMRPLIRSYVSPCFSAIDSAYARPSAGRLTIL